MEDYVFVYKGRLFTGTKPLKLTGNTPQTFQIDQPVTGHVTQWLLTVFVQLKGGRGLTVRFVDLGKTKS